MAFPRLKEFAKKNGWKINKNFAYGEVEEYLFTVSDVPGFKVFFTPLVNIQESEKELILTFLNSNKEQLKFFEAKFNKDILTVKFKEAFWSMKVEVMENYISSIVQFLKEKKIVSNKPCAVCGEGGSDEKVYIEFMYSYAHNKCINEVISEKKRVADEMDFEEKNYLLGFVGGLMGGIISSIPWILVQVFFNRIAAVLAALIGMGALKGYTILKGKIGPLTRWIIAFVTFISIIISQFVLIGIIFLKNHIPLSIENYHKFFQYEELSKKFNSALSIALFMAVLGIIPIFLSLKGKGKDYLLKIRKDD